jgi:hypothetical protein
MKMTNGVETCAGYKKNCYVICRVVVVLIYFINS